MGWNERKIHNPLSWSTGLFQHSGNVYFFLWVYKSLSLQRDYLGARAVEQVVIRTERAPSRKVPTVPIGREKELCGDPRVTEYKAFLSWKRFTMTRSWSSQPEMAMKLTHCDSCCKYLCVVFLFSLWEARKLYQVISLFLHWFMLRKFSSLQY